MADFRMKLFVLAGLATAFAGMAFGQASGCTATANAVFARSESNDDQVADTYLVCSSGAAGIAAGQTISMTVYLSPSVNITSLNVGTSSTPVSEAEAGLNTAVGSTAFVNPFPKGSATAGNGSATISGSVSGNSVTFSGITFPAAIAAATNFQITITNIKIAASTVATGSGVPTGISETIFISGTGVTPAAITTGSAVAYVSSGLTGIKAGGGNNNGPFTDPLCNETTAWGSGAAGVNYTVAFAENFPNSFKIQGSATAGQATGAGTPGGAAANTTLGSWFTNHTETGYTVTGESVATNQATSGTRIKLIFNNIPANVTVFVPITIAGTNAGVATLTASETGAYSAVAGSTANAAPGAASDKTAGTGIAAALTVTSGSATAIYEITTVSTAQSTFVTNVYLAAAAGAVPAPTSAITTTVSFAPIGATSNVPNFVNGASTTTVNGSTFVACSTTLLFPFVTNQAGFESGLAISNTGADLLGTKNGAAVSSVTGQSGSCVLTFFGNATASSNPPAFTTAAAVVPGTTWTGTLTSVTGGTPNTFGGYMIAHCNFLFAHGFTYITYNIGQSNAMAMGYVAFPLGTARATPTTGAPESLGN